MDLAIKPDLEAAVITKLTRRLLPFLFLLYIVAYLDRINVGFAALQMQKQFGFSDAVYGLGAGVFFAGYFFFQVPSNLALAQVGPRRWIAALMVVWGAISSAMVFISGPRSFYALRFFLGAAEAGFFPGMILYLKNWFPARARAKAVALFMTAGPIAGVMGGPISGALLGLHSRHISGWQWLFLIEGLPAVLLGIVVFVFLTDYPEAAAWLNDEERARLIEVLSREQESHPGPAPREVFSAFANWKIWLLIIVYFGATTCAYGLSLWLPNLIHNVSKVGNFGVGLLSTIPYLATAVAMVLVGMHSDRTGERRWHLALSAFAGAIGLWCAAFATSTVPQIVFLSLALLSAFSMMGPFWATSTSLLSGTAAAAGIALINSFGNLGGFFGPYVIGVVRNATGDFRGGLVIAGAMLAVSGGLAIAVRETKPTLGSQPELGGKLTNVR
jgi:ACS family tartrate transporter-like MFS transporter